jgi:hypothetical protein
MRRLAACTILGALLGASPGAVPGAAPGDSHHAGARPAVPRFHPGIVMSDSAQGLTTGDVGTRFDLWTLRDLFVRVKVKELPRVAILRLKFINPAGETILEETTAYSTDPRVRSVDDPLLGRQADVFRARHIPGGYALDREIAVAGSVLWRSPAFNGDWTVQASVTGLPEPLIAPLQFVGH